MDGNHGFSVGFMVNFHVAKADGEAAVLGVVFFIFKDSVSMETINKTHLATRFANSGCEFPLKIMNSLDSMVIVYLFTFFKRSLR